MEVVIDRDAFLKGLQMVQNIVEPRQTLPILANVLLEIAGVVGEPGHEDAPGDACPDELRDLPRRNALCPERDPLGASGKGRPDGRDRWPSARHVEAEPR